MQRIRNWYLHWMKIWCSKLLEKLSNLNRFDETIVQCQDVIWAQMPLSQEALWKVPPEHRIRPFLIIEVMDAGCKAYACSTKSGKDASYYIKKENYGLQKDNYIDYSKVWMLPYENMKATYFHLQDEDFENVCHKKIVRIDKKAEFGIGSVLKKQDVLYIVYKVDKNKCYTHRIYDKQGSSYGICYQPLSLKKHVCYIDLTSSIPMIDFEDCELYFQLNKEQRNALHKKEIQAFSRKDRAVKLAALFKEVQMAYPFGSIFYDRERKEEVIYLFHLRKRGYGFYPNENDQVHYIVRKLNVQNLIDQHTCCEEAFLRYACSHMALQKDMRMIVEQLLTKQKENTVT